MMTKWRMVVCFSMFAVAKNYPEEDTAVAKNDPEEDTAGEYLFLIVTE